MGQSAQTLFTVALSVGGGALMLYWIVCVIILLRGGDPERLHRR